MKALKKITNRCITNDWIHKDPFVGIKFREVPTEPEFLTIEELNRIYECDPVVNGWRWSGICFSCQHSRDSHFLMYPNSQQSTSSVIMREPMDTQASSENTSDKQYPFA